jgi:DNA-binding Lrp family transcriptional regulator
MVQEVTTDEIDQQLLRELARDGRATFGHLGRMVGLSASAVKRRVDRLIADGVIEGFGIRTGEHHLGPRIEAYVELYCKGTVSPGELRRILEPIPQVVAAATVSGAADALILVAAPDIRALEMAIERIRSFPIVDHSETTIVLSRLINRD